MIVAPEFWSPSCRKKTIMKITKNIDFLLLAIWLILTGLTAFVTAIAGLKTVLDIAALATDAFILLGR